MFKNLVSSLLLLASADVLAEGFYLNSADIQGQVAIEQVYNSFGCSGKNISPQLHWKNAPAGTKSFAITVYDPDAPTGSGWWHWIVFNIPTSFDNLKTGASSSGSGKSAMPAEAVESVTSYGSKGFGGACPPRGDKPHRYIFTVHALNIDNIDQDSDARPELIGFFINKHAIAKASLMAYFGR